MAINCILRLFRVPSVNNRLADRPSRSLSLAESRLSVSFWERLQDAFGGPNVHSVDLMVLLSNVMRSSTGAMLPFFSPHPTPSCYGVNMFSQSPDIHPPLLFSNPYVFPPICRSCLPFPCHLPLWFRMFGLIAFGGLFFHIVFHLVYFLRVYPRRVAIKIPGLCLGIYGRFVWTLCKEGFCRFGFTDFEDRIFHLFSSVPRFHAFLFA